MADAPSQAAIYLARLAVTVVVVFIVLGFVWYGFSLEVHNRIWRNFADRLGGHPERGVNRGDDPVELSHQLVVVVGRSVGEDVHL